MGLILEGECKAIDKSGVEDEMKREEEGLNEVGLLLLNGSVRFGDVFKLELDRGCD